MKPDEMTAVQERRFRKSVDYFRKNREIYVRRIKKILEEYKNSVGSDRSEDDADLLQCFDGLNLKTMLSDNKLCTMPPPSTQTSSASSGPNQFLSYPPLQMMQAAVPVSDASPVFGHPWQHVGVEAAATAMNENQFNFGMPPIPAMSVANDTAARNAAAFGAYNYGMSPFYPALSAFCACADCMSKPNVEMANNTSYSVYSSGETSLQKSLPSASTLEKNETSNSNSSEPYSLNSSSNAFESEGKFDLQRYYSSGGEGGTCNSSTTENATSESETFMSSPNSDKHQNRKENNQNIDHSGRIISHKSTYQSDNATPFTAFTNDSVDYYATMNTFPNQNHVTSNSTTLFASEYNRGASAAAAIVGAGDSAATLNYRSGTLGSMTDQQAMQSSISATPSMMMYNNTASPYAAIPYLSWSQGGESLMMPTLFTPNNVGLDATVASSAYNMQGPIGSQPATYYNSNVSTAVGSCAAGNEEQRPRGHDEHNPDYSNCFASSNPNVSNAGQESF